MQLVVELLHSVRFTALQQVIELILVTFNLFVFTNIDMMLKFPRKIKARQKFTYFSFD